MVTLKTPHTVITTHINADFDAIASMLAAQKLYPDAVVVFPGSQEKNLRNFFVSSMVYLFNMAEIKEICFDHLKTLVLVDTKQPDRIGKFATLLDKPGIKIHIYDHHPPRKDDIKGEFEVQRQTGATTTLLTEIIRKKRIAISPEEATILCLGIYEDTGGFTYSSTTPAEFEAAAFLLRKGANLNLISDLTTKEINPEQVGLLNDMIENSTWHHRGGLSIVLATVSRQAFVPDFAFLVQKLLKMTNSDALIALGRMGGKVYVVARSRSSHFDAAQVVKPFGGGGHATAAAAAVKDQPLSQIEQALLSSIHAITAPNQQAETLMSSPALSVDRKITCKGAGKLLTRYNINALVVTHRQKGADRLFGYISRQVVEKALFHHLGHVAVEEYTTTEPATVSPQADISEIQNKIINNKQRVLPVVENKSIVGVITRTDLLNTLVQNDRLIAGKQSPHSSQSGRIARTRSIRKFMRERLPQKILHLLKSIGEIAAECNVRAYVIGGFVRDLFLYRKNDDIDIVIEGDGIVFAQTFARLNNARIHTYKKFRTAVIIFQDGFKIDVASARTEYYASPAALPTVEMSSLKLDLFRRDFTINTLAILLNPESFGTLIDFFASQKDLKEKVIRVLHNLSFVEDPTRVFRAIRFEQRFGFKIGKLTKGLIHNAIKREFFKRLSGHRVFNEFRHILEEENPLSALNRLFQFNLLSVVHPALKYDKKSRELIQSAQKVVTWFDLLFLDESYRKWVVFFLVLIQDFSDEDVSDICVRLEMKSSYRQVFLKDRNRAVKCLQRLERKRKFKNSYLYKELSELDTELVLYVMSSTEKLHLKRAISHYFTKLRYVTTSISGKDIKSLGVRPGPVYRELINLVLNAKLNGEIKNRREELAFVKKQVAYI